MHHDHHGHEVAYLKGAPERILRMCSHQLSDNGEPVELDHPPRPRDESLLRGFVVWRVVFVSLLFLAGIFGAWFWAMYNYDDAVVASTLAVNTLVAMEVFYLFAVRYLDTPSITLRGVLGTPVVLLAVLAVIVPQSLFTWVPWFQDTFASAALSPEALGFAVLAGVAVLVLLELETAIRRRFRVARG